MHEWNTNKRMGPYSHIVVASQLTTYIQPENPSEYYWGAVAPDIRYLFIGMPRSQTHISVKRILSYSVQYPALKDFVKGYLVHCFTDELDLPGLLHGKFPFRLQHQRLSVQQCSVIMEFFNIERVKPIKHALSGINNAILQALGIDDERADKFSQEVGRYITSPTYASSADLFQRLGFIGDSRIEKYRRAAEQFQNHWMRKHIILAGLQVGRVNREIVGLVKSRIPVV